MTDKITYNPEELKQKWEQVYHDRTTEQLGWYEEDPRPSLDLIQRSGIAKTARQLHVGVGSSTLIDRLLDEGYQGITASDLSTASMQILRERLADRQTLVEWIEDDLLHPEHLRDLGPVDLWHDRAVLHFFNEDDEKKAYTELLDHLLAVGGHVIIGVFHKDGSKICNNLPVHGYDSDSLVELLGPDYSLIESFDYTYINPRGEDRPYVYALFKRIDS
ncbi:MAG: class I SAM-dependent methyltransferase [Flavobacteriales bacterium]|nr:class I SAM-dependent methyltransferase [Flavobacteriales bacterium]